MPFESNERGGSGDRIRAGGLTILTGGAPGVDVLQQQVQQLQNQVNAQGDYTQPLNPLHLCYAEYNTAAALSLATGTGGTRLQLDTRVRDTHNAVTTGAAWAFRAPFTGPYHMDLGLLIDTGTMWGAGEIAYVGGYVNGVVNKYFAFWGATPGAGVSVYASLRGSARFWLNTGQLWHPTLIHNAGVSVTLFALAAYNWITIQYTG